MQDIPKIFTAIAEWSACLVFVFLLKKRLSRPKVLGVMASFLVGLCVLQLCIGIWPVKVWIPSMAVAMLLMYVCILICCDVSPLDAGLYWAMSFMVAEFIASFEWQIWTFAAENFSVNSPIGAYGFMLSFYILFYGIFYLLQKRFIPGGRGFLITAGEFAGCILMTVTVFLMSNISYVYPGTPFSASMQGELFYIRTLVDFSGVLILITQQSRFMENQLKTELMTTSLLMNKQYEQYQLSKNNIEILNRKYHDLKHQISVIRSESDAEKKESYLEEMETGLKIYESQNKTGNKVLDIILTGKSMYCVQKNINFTCVADGTLLEFMNVMDICSIFGNALDNAIESSEKVLDIAKRIIRVAVYVQNRFVIIRFENYFEERFETEERNGIKLPVTTKKRKEYHGFGLRSIQAVAEKYGGTMTVETEKNWFYLRLLFPQND